MLVFHPCHFGTFLLYHCDYSLTLTLCSELSFIFIFTSHVYFQQQEFLVTVTTTYKFLYTTQIFLLLTQFSLQCNEILQAIRERLYSSAGAKGPSKPASTPSSTPSSSAPSVPGLSKNVLDMPSSGKYNLWFLWNINQLMLNKAK